MSVFTDHDDVERARPIPMVPEEAARISAELAEFDSILRRLHAETENLAQENPHRWAGMNSDLQLTLAGSLPELLAVLRPDGDSQRIVAVEYLDPDPPELVL